MINRWKEQKWIAFFSYDWKQVTENLRYLASYGMRGHPVPEETYSRWREDVKRWKQENKNLQIYKKKE